MWTRLNTLMRCCQTWTSLGFLPIRGWLSSVWPHLSRPFLPVCCVLTSCEPPGPLPAPQGACHIIEAITHPGAELLTPSHFATKNIFMHDNPAAANTAQVGLCQQTHLLPAVIKETKLDSHPSASDSDSNEWNLSTVFPIKTLYN